MTYLAIDIGASSGKLVRGWLEDGRIETQTVHRFSHSLQKRNGHLCWDLDYIISEIIRGIDKAGPVDWISIDTWAVDFLLLGKDGKPISDPVSYRDSRTAGIQCPVDRNELYSRTGIQFQEFNTIYQLLALQKEQPGLMDEAEDLLFIPDYIAYILTGKKIQEYTNATTTGLVKAGTAEWDMDLIRRLGFNERLFKPLSMSGSVKCAIPGRASSFILAPTHDTACAVLACPLSEDSLYLSSGTWSLLGCVTDSAVTSDSAREANLTNEGADDGRIRLLKNIMGTWMLQCLRRECGENTDFTRLQKMAQTSPLRGLVNPMDSRFLSPASMTEEVNKALAEAGYPKAENAGECANVIYHSLAAAYRDSVRQIESVTGRRFSHLAIAGGGSRDDYLNRLTKESTGLDVTTGPQEGSAAGNIISAMLHTGQIERKDIQKLIEASFDIKHVE